MLGDAVVLWLFIATPFVLSAGFIQVRAAYASAQRPRARWALLVAGNVLLFLLLLTLAAAAAEGWFRWAYDTTDSFALTRTTHRWMERHFQRNAQGYRDSIDYERTGTAGRQRITFLGDSFTAGHGIANVEDRFANLVRGRLSHETEVHVFAELGLDTGGQAGLLSDALISGYQTDMIVLVYCLNDISDLLPEWQESLSETYDRVEDANFFVRHSFLANRCYFKLLSQGSFEVRDYFRIVYSAYDGPVWRQQQLRLRSIADLCRSQDCRLAVVLFPFVHEEAALASMQGIHSQLRQFWRRHEVPCLDLLSTFQNELPQDLTVNSSDAHPNERAHRLAADAIEAFLETLLSAHNPSYREQLGEGGR